jgi:hypothetical protein
MRTEIVPQIAELKKRVLQGRDGVLEKVGESQALADFRAVLGARDSFFRLQDSVAGFLGHSGDVHGAYVGQFVIVFRRLDLSSNLKLYSILLQTLQELLKKVTSSDALFLTMCLLAPMAEEVRTSEPSIVLRLEAIGSAPEQAELRWSLGLAHIQEALLSAPQLLKQHLAKTDS